MAEALSHSGRVALVTGASRGIGYAAAKLLAKGGAHVVAVARTVGGLEELDDELKSQGGGGATLVPLDLKDGEGIDRLAAEIFRRWGRLDALLGNAGVLGVLTPAPFLTPKDWDELLAVNVTANWRLIRAFDPLLKRSDAARVAFLTSGVARRYRPFWSGYAMTKAALEALALTYAAECASTNIKVNLYSPGPTDTAMYRKAMPGADFAAMPKAADVAPKLVELLSPSFTRNGEMLRFRD